MTSYLPVGCRVERGNSDKGKSKGPQRYNLQTGINRLISSNGDLNRETVSHLANGWSSLKPLSACNAVHCVTDPRAMRALIADK